MKLAILALYNIALLAGTVYIVQFWHWSPWWFMLAITFSAGASAYREKTESA